MATKKSSAAVLSTTTAIRISWSDERCVWRAKFENVDYRTAQAAAFRFAAQIAEAFGAANLSGAVYVQESTVVVEDDDKTWFRVMCACNSAANAWRAR